MRQFFRAAALALLGMAFVTPAAPQGDRVQQAGAIRARLANAVVTAMDELRLFDQINRMAVSQGQMTAADADQRLRAKGQELSTGRVRSADIPPLQNQHMQVASAWAQGIAVRINQGAVWPAGGAAAWQPLGSKAITRFNTDYRTWLGRGWNTRGILRDLRRAQVLTYGRAGLDATTDPFAGEDQRIANALTIPRARDMMAAALGLRPSGVSYAPPQGQTAAAPPAPANNGGGPFAGTVGPRPPSNPPSPPVTSAPPLVATPQAGPRTVTSAPPFTVDPVGAIRFEANVDRPGQDYRNFDLPAGAGAEYCARACTQDNVCRAFTYVRPGVQKAVPRCWLKNNIPAGVARDCCVSGVRTSADPNTLASALFNGGQGQPPQRQPQVNYAEPVRIAVSWVGVDADLVGTATNGNPDGYPDGHWRATLLFSSPQPVAYISIKSSDQNGNVVPPHHWDSRDPQFWLLAVYANGQRVNRSHVGSLGTWQGQVYLDLYGGNSGGWLVPGRFTVIEVGLANGQVVKSVARL